MRQIKIVYIIFIVLLSSVLYVNAGIDGKCGNNIACVCGERLNATRTLTSSDTLTNCNNLTVLTIEAEHISLDCAGNKISGNYTGSGTDSSSTGYIGHIGIGFISGPNNNITIKNCIIEGTAIGIRSARGPGSSTLNNFTIENNTIRNLVSIIDISSIGIILEKVENGLIKNNFIYNLSCGSCTGANGPEAIAFIYNSGLSQSNISIEGNTISNITSSTISLGIDFNTDLQSGQSVSINKTIFIKNNIFKNIGTSIIMADVENITIENNTITDVIRGIELSGRTSQIYGAQKGISIVNNNIFNATFGFDFSFLRDLGSAAFTGSNFTLRDNIIRNSTVGIQFGNETQLTLINNSFGNNTIDINTTGVSLKSVLIYENAFASLIWNQTNLTIIGDLSPNLFNSIVIVNNSVFVNSTKHPNLNKTINFTFFQHTFANYNRYILYRDGVACPSAICSRLANSPVMVNVYGFSNYSILADTFKPDLQLSSSEGTSFRRLTNTIISCSYADDNPSTIAITSSDGTTICEAGGTSCSNIYTPTVAETKTVTCTATDNSSNINTATLTITVDPDLTGSPSSFSGGSKRSSTIGDIVANQPFTMQIPANIAASLGVESITVLSTVNAPNAKLEVNGLSDAPSGVSIPGNVYKYLEIRKTNLADSALKEAVVVSLVKKEWIQQNNVNPSNIVLFRLKDGNWERYTPSNVQEKDGTYRFEAKVPGFSTFAIGVDKQASQTTTDATTDDGTSTSDNTNTPTTDKNVEKTSLMPVLVIILVLIVIGAVVWYLVGRKKK